MKYFPVFFLTLLLFACNSQRSSQNDLVAIELQLGEQDQMEIRITPTSSLMPTKENGHRALLLGQLSSPSTLTLKNQSLMMTTISMQQAVAPESGHLDISSDQEGKWALVRAHWAGDLYEAEILCVFEEGPSQKQLQAYEEGSEDILQDCK